MRRILVGAVTVIFGGAVALGVRNAVVDGAGSEASGVVEEAGVAPEGAGAHGSVDTSAGAPAAAGALGDTDAPAGRGVGGGEADSAAATGAEGEEVVVPAAREVMGGEVGPVSERGSAMAEQEPDARTVLLRASEAYEAVRSLRAEFVQTAENPLLRNRVTSRGTLVQRRPDRFLMKFSEPAGDVIVSDGTWIWIYYPSVDEKQVIRTPVGAGGVGGADLQAQFLGDPLTRFTPTLEGTESVGGRRAYVLLLTPRVDTGFRSLKVWVDAQDHLVRRFELVESNGVKRFFELEGLEVGGAAPDSLFRFSPPEGARIVERG